MYWPISALTGIFAADFNGCKIPVTATTQSAHKEINKSSSPVLQRDSGDEILWRADSCNPCSAGFSIGRLLGVSLSVLSAQHSGVTVTMEESNGRNNNSRDRADGVNQVNQPQQQQILRCRLMATGIAPDHVVCRVYTAVLIFCLVRTGLFQV